MSSPKRQVAASAKRVIARTCPRRCIGVALCLSICSIILAACASGNVSRSARVSGASRAGTIRVMVYPKSPVSFLSYIARDQGFFARNHLHVSLVTLGTPTLGVSAVEGGSLDVVEADPITMYPYITKGLQFQLIAGASRQLFDLVVAKTVPHIGAYPASIRVLKGKSVAVTGFNTASSILLDLILADAHVSPSSVNIVNAGGNPGELSLLESGRVQAAIGNPSVTGIAERTVGAYVLCNVEAGTCGPRQLRGTLEYGEWVLSSFRQSHPRAVTALRRSWSEAYAWMSNPANGPIVQRDLAADVALPYPIATAGFVGFLKTVEHLVVPYYNVMSLRTYDRIALQHHIISKSLNVGAIMAKGTPTS